MEKSVREEWKKKRPEVDPAKVAGYLLNVTAPKNPHFHGIVTISIHGGKIKKVAVEESVDLNYFAVDGIEE